ncbi:helix-turn-helix transcriptional regulator [Actinomycetes bacterium KLBMP 9759]
MAQPDAAEYVPGSPHPGLAGYVLRYGGYREFSASVVRRRQAPTGSCTLILGMGPSLRLDGPAGPTSPTSFLAGMHDAAVITAFSGRQHGVQVDLTPLGVYALLGRPMHELADSTPHLDELEVPVLAGLPERLAHDAGWPQRFARVDATLLALLDAGHTRPDPEVSWAWQRLVRSHGRVGIQHLADGTGWSRRHLLNRFRTQVGLGPKASARVVRFQHAAELLVPTLSSGPTGPWGSLADVAATCGYADHAHLVREFRALAGCTPREYLAEWS